MNAIARHRPTIVFLTTMIVGGAMLLSTWVQHGPLAALSILVVETSASCLRAIGVDVAGRGHTLVAPGWQFGLEVHNDCNGAWAHLVFLAAVLAFPAGWRAQLVGLVAGEAVLFALNIVRVMSLVLIMAHAPQFFHAAHVYVWQFLIIGLALLLFTIWVDKVAA